MEPALHVLRPRPANEPIELTPAGRTMARALAGARVARAPAGPGRLRGGHARDRVRRLGPGRAARERPGRRPFAAVLRGRALGDDAADLAGGVLQPLTGERSLLPVRLGRSPRVRLLPAP